jgi:UDP-glucose 4-epimerase
MTTVLVTGGAGYIGSHTVIELVKASYSPVIFDNLCNSKQNVLKRLKTITRQDIAFVKGWILGSM